MSENRCGGCTACCQIYLVSEGGIHSLPGNLCPHAKLEIGCSMYDKRPEVCRNYRCHWLRSGNENTAERPDQLGVVMEESVVAGYPDLRSIHVMRYWEYRVDALRRTAVKRHMADYHTKPGLRVVWTRRKLPGQIRYEDILYHRCTFSETEVMRLHREVRGEVSIIDLARSCV